MNINYIPAFLWLIVVTVLSVLPGIQLPSFDLFSADKLGHAVAYLGVVIFILGGHTRTENQFSGKKTIFQAILFAIAYGILMEWVQGTFFPGRFCEIDDMIANAFGAFAGGVLFWGIKNTSLLRNFLVPNLIFLLLAVGCQPTDEEFDLPTKICVRTQHHHQPIPNAKVYVKFNTDSFPGYDAAPSYYDRVFKTDKNARGCLSGVPEGVHWLVAFGYDSLYYPNDVFGSIKVEISLSGKATVDTILYISEE